MPFRHASQTRRRSTLAVVVFYGVLTLAGAFFHHDLACHERSRTHCNSCLSSQSAQKLDAASSAVELSHLVVGRIDGHNDASVETLLRSALSGRSPPTSAL